MHFLRTAMILISLSYLVTSRRILKRKKLYPWTPFFDAASARSEYQDSPYRPKSPSMELTSRNSFNRNCDGQCFFFPDGCDRIKLDCSAITSIVELSPDCEDPDPQSSVPWNVDKGLCKKDTRYFTVSLLRRIQFLYCFYVFDKSKLRRCINREFVAVSFFDDGNESANTDDIWYVCASGEPSVISWTNMDGSGDKVPKLIKNTLPYASKGAGVIWSEIKYLKGGADDSDILVCRFIISTSQLRLEINQDLVNKNSTGTNPGVGSTNSTRLRIKMANGVVKRDDRNGEFIHPILHGEDRGSNEYYVSHDAIELSRIESKIIEEEEEIKTDPTIGARLDNLHSVCKNNKKINCFVPSDDSHNDCLKKKSCSMLVIIQKIEHSKLKFYMVVKPSIRFGQIQSVIPDDWASIGFVNGPIKDVSDGAITFSCMAKGSDTINVVIGFKLAKNNINNVYETHQDRITDKKFLIDPETGRFMCTWTLSPPVTIHILETIFNNKEEVHRSNKPAFQTLESYNYFDLQDTHQVLMASGKHFYEDWVITFHRYREILQASFSAKKLPINSDIDLLSTKSTSCKCLNLLFLNILSCILSIINSV